MPERSNKPLAVRTRLFVSRILFDFTVSPSTLISIVGVKVAIKLSKVSFPSPLFILLKVKLPFNVTIISTLSFQVFLSKGVPL